MQPHWMTSTRDSTCPSCRRKIREGDPLYVAAIGTYLCKECGLLTEAQPAHVGEIEEAIESDLAKLPAEARKTALAQGMLYLGRQLDHHEAGSRDIPMFWKEVRATMEQLHAQFPPVPQDDSTAAAKKGRTVDLEKLAAMTQRDD